MIAPGDTVLLAELAPEHELRAMAIEPGDHVVIYLGRPTATLAAAVRWPLPTTPRTTYLVVEASAPLGFSRVRSIDAASPALRARLTAPKGGARAVVLSPSATVLSVVDATDPHDAAALRTGVSRALCASWLRESGWGQSGVIASAPMLAALVGRVEALIGPLLSEDPHAAVGEPALRDPDLLDSHAISSNQPRPGIVATALDEAARSEAVERLVGVGYGYLGDLGGQTDVLVSPEEEPRHSINLRIRAAT